MLDPAVTTRMPAPGSDLTIIPGWMYSRFITAWVLPAVSLSEIWPTLRGEVRT